MARIALIGDNSIEYVNALLDIWNVGDCAVLIDWRIPIHTAIDMMREVEVNTCYIDKRLLDVTTKECLSDTYIKVVPFEVQSNSAMILPESIRHKYHKNRTDSEAVVFYSSGTTGKSKGVVLSHFAINANADAILDYMELNKNDCIYIAKSLSHSSTLTGELLVSLKSNTRLIVAPTIVPPRFVINNIAKYKVTTLCLNPTLLQLFTEEFQRKNYSIPTLKTIYISGSILNDKVYNLAHSIFKEIAIYNVYGLSEAGPRVTAQRSSCCKSNSVGVPISGVDVAIVDNDGNCLRSGERGIIHVNTPSRYLYYISGSEKFYSLYKGWLNTGDIGYFDQNQELHVIDRIDDVINIAAHKVYPSDVERVILDVCHVTECSVVKEIIDDVEYLVCLYVGENNFAKERLSSLLLPYEIPKIYLQCDEIPKTRNGKISKRVVRILIQKLLKEREKSFGKNKKIG